MSQGLVHGLCLPTETASSFLRHKIVVKASRSTSESMTAENTTLSARQGDEVILLSLSLQRTLSEPHGRSRPFPICLRVWESSTCGMVFRPLLYDAFPKLSISSTYCFCSVLSSTPSSVMFHLDASLRKYQPPWGGFRTVV